MKRFRIRRIVTALYATSLLSLSTPAGAAAFQLFEQDGGSYLANYHAGYAASATDASTAWYNPAGITRIKNQQFVFAGDNIITDFKYKGTVTNAIFFGLGPVPVTAQGGAYGFVPSFHYVAPITDRIGFGFSVVVPFGLKTNYGSSTMLRYAATKTSINVVDVSPNIAFLVTEPLSLGIGLDIQRMHAEYDTVAGSLQPGSLDTTSTNKADDTAYGYHLGALYEFNPCTRVGLSYHSKVVHHLNGTSRFEGPLADIAKVFSPPPNYGAVLTSHASTKVTLPPYTALSIYHKVAPPVALAATAMYVQWNTVETLTLNGLSGVNSIGATLQGIPFKNVTNLQAVVPQHYRNVWNLSIGGDYYATECITLRAGLGWDQSPVRDAYRDVRLPDSDRYITALGGHYQATKAVGVDVGWLHVFTKQVTVNPPESQVGVSKVSTDGKVKGGADVYGVQLTWDIV